MFHFEHQGKAYRVWFQHHCHTNRKDGDAMTVATLFCINDYPLTLIHEVVARCSKKDQFNRATGRRVSLARLLHEWSITGMNKELRKSIWLQYARRHKDGQAILIHNSKAGKDVN